MNGVQINEVEEQVAELQEKIEDLEDQIEDLKYKHEKEIAEIKKQHEEELKNASSNNTPKQENTENKEKDDNILATLETLKAENAKLEANLKSTKKQWEDEVAFLKEENELAEIMAAEARVKAAQVCTDLDYYRLKYKQALKLLEKK